MNELYDRGSFEALESRLLMSATPIESLEQSEVHVLFQETVQSSQVLIIDQSVTGYQDLLTKVDTAQVAVHFVNSQSDGVAQVTDILDNYQNLHSVHILSHGAEGELFLGKTTLSNENFLDYQSQLSQWGEALATHGDILLYGCHVAGSENGRTFIDQFAASTQADVLASDDLTGVNGDAELEYQKGTVESHTLFTQSDFEHAHVQLADVVYNGTSANESDLKALIQSVAADTTIVFESDVTIDFDNQIKLTKAINFRVAEDVSVVFDGQNKTRLLRYALTTGDQVSISGDLTFQNASTVKFFDKVTMDPVSLELTRDDNGGAHYTMNDYLVATEAEKLTFYAVRGKQGYGGYGAAVYVRNADLSLDDGVTFKDNFSFRRGGAVYHQNGHLTINDTTFENNNASDYRSGASSAAYGGAIYSSAGNFEVNISNSRFIENSVHSSAESGRSSSYGAAVYLYADKLNVTHNNFSENDLSAHAEGNRSYAYGAAIYSRARTQGVTFTANTFSDNLSSATSTANHSYVRGGAVYNDSRNGQADFTNNTFLENTAESEVLGKRAYVYGGAVYNYSQSSLLKNNILSENLTDAISHGDYAYSYGGAFYNYNRGGHSLIQNNNATQNSSVAKSDGLKSRTYAYGGAIYNYSYDQDSNFSGNVLNHNEVHSTLVGDSSYAYASGAALYNYTRLGSVSFVDTEMNHNSLEAKSDGNKSRAYAYGSALYSRSPKGAATITDAEFNANHSTVSTTGKLAYLYGGAVYNNSESSSISRSHFKLTHSDVDATGVKANARVYGGALYNYNRGGESLLSENAFESNDVEVDATSDQARAYAYGGALYQYNHDHTLNLRENSFTSNELNVEAFGLKARSYAYGGAAYSNTRLLSATASELSFTNNKAESIAAGTSSYAYSYGGAFYNTARKGHFSLESSQFSGNENSARANGIRAYAYGGALYDYSQSTTLNENNFTENKTEADTNVNKSRAYAYGGGSYIYNRGGDSTFTANEWKGNESTVSAVGNKTYGYSRGGGVYAYNYDQKADWNDNVISANESAVSAIGTNSRAYNYGAGLYNYTRLGESTFSANEILANELNSVATRSYNYGAGAHVLATTAGTTFNRNAINQNTSSSTSARNYLYGGGIYFQSTAGAGLDLINNTIAENSLDAGPVGATRLEYGSGVYTRTANKVTEVNLYYNTIYGNELSGHTNKAISGLYLHDNVNLTLNLYGNLISSDLASEKQINAENIQLLNGANNALGRVTAKIDSSLLTKSQIGEDSFTLTRKEKASGKLLYLSPADKRLLHKGGQHSFNGNDVFREDQQKAPTKLLAKRDIGAIEFFPEPKRENPGRSEGFEFSRNTFEFNKVRDRYARVLTVVSFLLEQKSSSGALSQLTTIDYEPAKLMDYIFRLKKMASEDLLQDLEESLPDDIYDKVLLNVGDAQFVESLLGKVNQILEEAEKLAQEESLKEEQELTHYHLMDGLQEDLQERNDVLTELSEVQRLQGVDWQHYDLFDILN